MSSTTCRRCETKSVAAGYRYCYDCNFCPMCKENRMEKHQFAGCHTCTARRCDLCDDVVGDDHTRCWTCNNIKTCDTCSTNTHHIKYQECGRCFRQVECRSCHARRHNPKFTQCQPCSKGMLCCTSTGCNALIKDRGDKENYCFTCIKAYATGRTVCEISACHTFKPMKYQYCKSCVDNLEGTFI